LAQAIFDSSSTVYPLPLVVDLGRSADTQMWEQLFGSAGQGGGALAQPEAEPGRASSNATAGEAAAGVRELAQKRVDAAWSKLREELDVQKLVWESLSLTPAKAKDSSFHDKIASLCSDLEGALNARSQDSQRAVLILKQALQVADQEGGPSNGAVLSSSMTTATHNAITQERTLNERRRLAETLEAASIQALPSGGAALREIEAMVVKCELREPKLERKVREVLGLPLPSLLRPAVSDTKTSSKLGGTVGPRQSSFGTVVTKKISSAPSQSLGGAVAVTGSRKSSRPVAAAAHGAEAEPEGIRSDLPPGLEAKEAGRKVREMAMKKIDIAWTRLEEELKVQKLVWESVALTKAKSKDYGDNIASLKSKFEKALTAKAYSLHGLFELEQALQMSPSEQELLGHSLLNAARDVVKQEHARVDRLYLADALTATAGPGGSPGDTATKQELQILLGRCELGDERLVRSVRQGLVLEKPKAVEMGAPVSAAKVSSSLLSDVTGLCDNEKATPRKSGPGRRAESMGSLVKAKKPADGHEPGQPARRIMGL